MIRPLTIAALFVLPALLPGQASAATASATYSSLLQVDGGTITPTLSFSGLGPVSKLTTTINLSKCSSSINNNGSCTSAGQPYAGEIYLSLLTPSGDTITLVNPDTITAVDSSDFVSWTFDDSATLTLLGNYQSLPSGTFRPYSNLSVFNGRDPNGTWTLQAQNMALELQCLSIVGV